MKMARSKILVLGLLAGLLVGLLFISGCAQSSSEGNSASTRFEWIYYAIIVVVIIAVFYLFMIRPQANQRKQQQKLMTELKPGDQVIGAGGIYGEIVSVDADTVVLKVESGAKIRVTKQSIVVKR
jgi:preprotein translocase subunit YajC